MRKQITAYGRKRKPGYVRVFRETTATGSLIRVQWTEPGAATLSTSSYDDSRNGIAQAKAFAQGVHDRLTAKVPVQSFDPLTLRQVWDKYVAAHINAWRPKSLRSATDRWKRVELVLGRETPAASLTPERLDDMLNTLLETRIRGNNIRSTNQVKSIMALLSAVYRWAEQRRLLPPSLVSGYRPKLSKEKARNVVQMHEYRETERFKVLAELSPDDSRQWRAWALTVLFAYCGPRQTAARSLEWADVDLEAKVIRWRPETDKMGRERFQPMPEPVYDAFLVALAWREKAGYQGRFVFFAVQDRGLQKDQPYTYQAYIGQLHAAEARAGVESIAYRGAHGFRRGIAGDVHSATGSEKQAADWIGDKSVRIVRDHYLLTRGDELRKTAELVTGTATKRNGPADEGEAGGDN